MDIPKWLDKYCRDAALKYASESTRKTYASCVGIFLKYFEKNIDPQHIPTDRIKDWLLTKTTINTRKHCLCAVNSFYELTVGMPNKIKKIPYPKSDKKLPIVLSVEEVQKMFSACENLKHKTILALLYSCGLRVGELINLKWENIDRSRMIINILAGKGRKDRQVPLSPDLIPILEEYYKEYKSRIYVLNGQFQDNELRYSPTSVNQVVKQLAEKAGLHKRVYTHLMRHNAFTHMAEAGTDINLIQKIAGHNNVKTTNIYLHLSHNHISKIKSPLGAIKL